MNTRKFFINQEEEIISIVDKVLQSPEKEIVLFFPRGAQIFQSNINLKLLKREADNAEKQLTIVTEDEGGQKIALKNNFVVFNSREEFDYYQEDKNPKDKEEITPEVEKEIIEPEKISKMEPAPAEEEKGDSRIAPAGRVIDLRGGAFQQPAISDIKVNKKDDNYFQKMIEEKKHFDDSLPGDEDFSLSIDVDEEKKKTKKSKEKTSSSRLVKGLKKSKSEKALVPKKSLFDVLKSIKSQKSRKEKIVPEAQIKEYEVVSSSEQSEAGDIIKAPRKPKKNWLAGFSVAFAVLGFIAVLGVVYFALPKAEILLTLNRQNVTTTVLAMADKNIKQANLAKGNIPAKELEIKKQQRQTFRATGEKQVNKKATGIITVYNEFSSAPQTLVETTRFLSEDGKLFRTTETITVPGATIEDGKIVASSIDVEVVADQPGEEFNIGPANFTIPGFKGSPKYQGFYGRSFKNMEGGKIGTVKFISEEDMRGAITDFANKDILNLVDEIKKQVPEGYVLLDNCIERQKTEDQTKAKVGDIVDSFEIVFDFSIRAVAFSKKDLTALAAVSLNKENSDAVSELEEESILIEYREVEPNFDKGIVKILANVSGSFVQNLDIDRLKADLAGKNPQEVKEYFNGLSEVADGEVRFWPFFVRSIPESLDRIKISVD